MDSERQRDRWGESEGGRERGRDKSLMGRCWCAMAVSVAFPVASLVGQIQTAWVQLPTPHQTPRGLDQTDSLCWASGVSRSAAQMVGRCCTCGRTPRLITLGLWVLTPQMATSCVPVRLTDQDQLIFWDPSY